MEGQTNSAALTHTDQGREITPGEISDTMTDLRQLTPQETFFVGGETSRVYQHTGGLQLLDGRETPGFGYDLFRARLQERIDRVPHFRWKLHQVPLGLDLPYWVEDENFSYDHHIRRIAVPSPGDRVALGELVSYLYTKHLDRKRPLWETWFIEGLADGQYAVMQKLHHCMMDGEGAAKLGEVMNDFEPGAVPRQVDPAISGARPGATPSQWQQALNVARRYSRLPLRASREVIEAVTPRLRERLLRGRPTDTREPAPLAHFNGDITGDRAFVFGSVPLADVKAVKNHFDTTVNDVVLALVSSSLRAYLLSRGELPAGSLRTSLPVSLRTEEDDSFSNRVTSTTVTLATAAADPVERLRAIARESRSAVANARGGAKGYLEVMQLLPPLLVNTVMNLAPPERTVAMVGANLLVSSVRGSPWPMYMAGARKTAMYPMSIITPGTGINVTCISYTDNIDFGITVEPSMFREPWELVDGLHTAIAEYVALIGGQTARRGKMNTGRRSGRKTATRRKSAVKRGS
jgi:diacylglycerol O-acyltransferase